MQKWNILEYLYYSLVLLNYTQKRLFQTQAMSLGLTSFIDVCILLYNLERGRCENFPLKEKTASSI